MDNRPRGREQNITGQGKGAYRRGSGLGTGPVGSPNGYEGRGGSSSGGGKRSGGSGGGLMKLILAVLVLLGGGGAGLSGMLGGGQSTTPSQPPSSYVQPGGNSLWGTFQSAHSSSGWTKKANTGKLDTGVDSSARAKRTTILGNQKDTVTIMVYMCGADLESRSGMATYDIQEMASATIGSNVNIIVYTGGAKSWRNNIVSSSVNQIYKVENGGIKKLEGNLGAVPMTTPSTLTGFIKYCAKNFPANRNELILWDHGGGSITGYGYDEKFASSGSMSLKGINEALKKSGMTFDFIGFDACLMATVENAMMLSNYADYLIASEETEPGVGWYYTNWITKLSQNTSMPTIEIGKNIVDDFVDVCAQKCAGQKTTLSVIDLAELEATVPGELKDFSASTLDLMKRNQYKTVSDARSTAREFASSTKIDQVDLVSLAYNLGTKDASNLADALLGAVKYNRTSSNMTNAYGLSIYFPYQKASKVNSAVADYAAIGMDNEYAQCIQKFASMEVAGQAVSGGTANPLGALSGLGNATGVSGQDMIGQLLMGLMSGNMGNVSGLTGSSGSFLGRSLDPEADTLYLTENRFNAEALVWTGRADGTKAMTLPDEQWALVQDLELNLFLDDGKGYIDMGLDNVFQFTEDGALSGEYQGTWLAINQQPVAYYHMDTVDDGENYTITGRVPAMLNDQRVDLILVFDNEHPHGYVAGARTVYTKGETETVPKNMLQLEDGDVIDFLCDYYTYGGKYQDSYYLGDQLVVKGDLQISDVYVDANACNATYRFTDIYNQQYWTPTL